MKMSLPDAVKSYLSMVKRKQSTKQLMAALERGGYPTRSKNFYTTVFGVLNRHAKTQGEITKVGGDWALAERYRGLPNERKRTVRAAEDRAGASEDETKDSA